MAEADPYLNEISMKFLRAVRARFGKDTGVEAINALQPILGKEWMGQLVYDMMADNHKSGGVLQITIDHSCQAKINVIKAIRGADSTLGLKEAKDLMEANVGTGPFTLKVTAGYFVGDNEEERLISVAAAAYREFNSIAGCRADYV